MYSFLFDVTSRTNIFENVLSIIQKTLQRSKLKLSKRLAYILNKLQSFPDTIVQHGFVFYSMSHNIDVKNYVICHYEAGPKRDTIQDFITNHIEVKTKELLNGGFRSFTEYVENIRYNLIIQLGV